MKPIGPLIREHRLIERIVVLLAAELHHIGVAKEVDPPFISAAVDFFRIYADRTHHGKEEDILFKTLAEKRMAPEHQRIMVELIVEHKFARKMVGGLDDAMAGYQKGNKGALESVAKNIKELVTLYPKHIEKEDKHFFFPILEYLSKKEQDAMLEEFREFDRNMIHEKYRKVVEGLENR